MAKQFRIACSGALSRVDTFIKSSSRNHSEASAKHNAQLEMCCSTVSLSSGVSRPSAHPIKASILRCRINTRSEEHTSELQSRFDLVCRLLLEKKTAAHSLRLAG